MRYKYYKKKHSRSGLAWSRPRADRGLSWLTSVFRTTIGVCVCVCVCKILSRSVEIWQYEGQNVFLSKNRERPSVNNVDCRLVNEVMFRKHQFI